MLINPSVVAAAQSRAASVRIPSRLEFDQRPKIDLARLAERQGYLARSGAAPTQPDLERILGTNDMVDEFWLERALLAGRAVCRLELRDAAGSSRGYATGFMISPRLLLTNEHVFQDSSQAMRSLAAFNYRLALNGTLAETVRFSLKPNDYFYADKKLDYAVVAVAAMSEDKQIPLSQFGFHRLIGTTGKVNAGEWVTIIQHPGGAPRQIALRENKLLPWLPTDDFLWYMTDTARGSSGAPVFNDSFQVVALHHSGKARQEKGKFVLRDGRRVASLDGIQEHEIDWVANEGVRASRICQSLQQRAPQKGTFIAEALDEQGTKDVMEAASSQTGITALAPPSPPSNGMVITVPIQLDVRPCVAPGGPSASTVWLAGNQSATASTAPAMEKLPYVDENYANRRGYDPDFLGVTVPMPKLKANVISSASRLLDGPAHEGALDYEIPYQHFSVVNNKQRRLAFFAAANVDFRPSVRRKSWTRTELAGWDSDASETWRIEPRIPEQDQLPDKFYTKDRKSFDKGHICRRDDVAWGQNKKIAMRANGDTFHVTNCSPQIAAYNQSKYDGLWGNLENAIAAIGTLHPLVVFSGPVLDPADPEFTGVDSDGEVKIQIPTRFWKVVAAKSSSHLECHAYLLEQDLSDVKMEELVLDFDASWNEYRISIEDLEKHFTPYLTFPNVLKKAQQKKNGSELFESLSGIATEIFRAGRK